MVLMIGRAALRSMLPSSIGYYPLEPGIRALIETYLVQEIFLTDPVLTSVLEDQPRIASPAPCPIPRFAAYAILPLASFSQEANKPVDGTHCIQCQSSGPAMRKQSEQTSDRLDFVIFGFAPCTLQYPTGKSHDPRCILRMTFGPLRWLL
ncbi:hypothetical protein PSPO01_07488 [Paraphaeosphaeria sporulosa]